MKFTTKDFKLTVEALNYKLGLPKNIDIDYSLWYGCVLWAVDIEAREWGIKSISPAVYDFDIEIKWSIDKSDLTTSQIQKLLQNDLGEHYPAEESANFIEGKIRLNRNYKVNTEIEFAGDLLMVNEVVVDFMDNEITII
jgi:hypothetical protein